MGSREVAPGEDPPSRAMPFYKSRFTGLFSRLNEMIPEAADPDIFLYGGEIPKNAYLPQDLVVGGAGFSREVAEGACVGEAIERFACYPMPQDQTLTTSYQKWPLEEEMVHPNAWVLFHDEQYKNASFPFEPLTEQTECRYTCFRHAITGEPVWIPEEFAYLFPRPGEPHRFAPAVSTGLSCGRRTDPVLLRGAQEVIERDALMGAWWGRYPIEEWESSRILGLFPQEQQHKIIRPNLTYHFYRIHSPYSSHVCVAILTAETRSGFCLSVGSACREQRDTAWKKATLEAIQGLFYVRYLKTEIQANQRSFDKHCHNFADHAVYYSLFPEEWKDTPFAHGAKAVSEGASASVNFSQGAGRVEAETVASLKDRLGQDHPILFRNVTPLEVIPRGYYVLKVVIPGLQPMHGNDHFPHLGGPLFLPRTTNDFALLKPHPFP